MTNVLKVLVNTIKEVGLSLTLLIKIYILIDRYTATVGATEVTYFLLEKCRVRAPKAVIAASACVSAKGGPVSYAIELKSFLCLF